VWISAELKSGRFYLRIDSIADRLITLTATGAVFSDIAANEHSID